MNEVNIVCSNQLTIRFDQLENGRVEWEIMPDEQIDSACHHGLLDLAECSVPLSALGIRALWEMCAGGVINASLALADKIGQGVQQRIAVGQSSAETQDTAKEVVVH